MTLVSWEGIGGLGQMGQRNYPLGPGVALGTLIETKKGRLGWSAPQACIQASASCEPAWAASPAGQSVLSWRQPACSSYPQPPLGLISALAASHFGCLPVLLRPLHPAPPPPSLLPSHSQIPAQTRRRGLARGSGLCLCQSCWLCPVPVGRPPCFDHQALWARGGARKAVLSALPHPSPWAWPPWTVCSPLLPHSMAGYPKPQHPGDRAQCCALSAR